MLVNMAELLVYYLSFDAYERRRNCQAMKILLQGEASKDMTTKLVAGVGGGTPKHTVFFSFLPSLQFNFKLEFWYWYFHAIMWSR
jgi:hypothetical protein